MMDLTRAKNCNVLSGEYWAEEKIDGHRLMLKRGEAYFRGLKQNAWDALPRQIQAIAPEVFVDGELYIPCGTASDVSRTANSDRLWFCGFYLPGADLLPHEHINAITAMGIDTPKTLGYGQWSKSELLRRAKREGIEGYVLKRKTTNPQWYKLKAENTIDAVVMVIKPGAGKYSGQCGAIVCGAVHGGVIVEICTASGMDDDTRKRISDGDIGRIVEVRYQGITVNNKLRHPRFVRFRNDKIMPDRLESHQ